MTCSSGSEDITTLKKAFMPFSISIKMEAEDNEEVKEEQDVANYDLQ